MTCLDFKGYSTFFSNDYLTNEGPQMKAQKAMLDRLVESRDDDKYDYTADGVNLYENSAAEALFWIPYLFFKNAFEWVAS